MCTSVLCTEGRIKLQLDCIVLHQWLSNTDSIPTVSPMILKGRSRRIRTLNQGQLLIMLVMSALIDHPPSSLLSYLLSYLRRSFVVHSCFNHSYIHGLLLRFFHLYLHFLVSFIGHFLSFFHPCFPFFFPRLSLSLPLSTQDLSHKTSHTRPFSYDITHQTYHTRLFSHDIPHQTSQTRPPTHDIPHMTCHTRSPKQDLPHKTIVT